MRILTTAVVLALPILMSFGADKGPQYDPATVVTLEGTVDFVGEIGKGEALEGINLTVKTKEETFRVYVAPVAFMKLFDLTFNKGDEIKTDRIADPVRRDHGNSFPPDHGRPNRPDFARSERQTLLGRGPRDSNRGIGESSCELPGGAGNFDGSRPFEAASREGPSEPAQAGSPPV